MPFACGQKLRGFRVRKGINGQARTGKDGLVIRPAGIFGWRVPRRIGRFSGPATWFLLGHRANQIFRHPVTPKAGEWVCHEIDFGGPRPGTWRRFLQPSSKGGPTISALFVQPVSSPPRREPDATRVGLHGVVIVRTDRGIRRAFDAGGVASLSGQENPWTRPARHLASFRMTGLSIRKRHLRSVRLFHLGMAS